MYDQGACFVVFIWNSVLTPGLLAWGGKCSRTFSPENYAQRETLMSI